MCAKSLSIHIPCDGCERGKQDGSSQYSTKGGKGLQKGPSTREEEVVIIIYPVHIQHVHTKKERKKKNPSFFSVGKEKVGGGWESGRILKKVSPKNGYVLCVLYGYIFSEMRMGRKLVSARLFDSMGQFFSVFTWPLRTFPKKTDRPLYVCVSLSSIDITTTLVAKITIII